jgi:hypothetical protein
LPLATTVSFKLAAVCVVGVEDGLVAAVVVVAVLFSVPGTSLLLATVVDREEAAATAATDVELVLLRVDREEDVATLDVVLVPNAEFGIGFGSFFDIICEKKKCVI